jgi:hypothetical protein
MKRVLQFFLVAVSLALASPAFAQLVIPEIPYDSAPNLLKLPVDLYMGEAAGVATNSKGHLFVYTRTGSTNVTTGTNRAFVRSSSRLLEFDEKGNYVREIGHGIYAFLFAQAVHIDPQDNIWVVDQGGSMVMKFDPDGHVVMTFGRKPEEIRVPSEPMPGFVPPPPGPNAGGGPGGGGQGGGGGGGGAAAGGPPADTGAGAPGDSFRRPTDVAWDGDGNLYVADGYDNSRIAKFDKDGKYIKSWGTRGTGPGQFHTPHSIAADAKGLVYVADRDNHRIQVFDGDGNFKSQIISVGDPWAICITPGPHQYLYSSNSNSEYDLDNGEIYKMELDGKIVGQFGHAGKQLKEFDTVNSIDCRNPNEIYVGELGDWRVQKITLHPEQAKK